jgi:hypothetical protein
MRRIALTFAFLLGAAWGRSAHAQIVVSSATYGYNVPGVPTGNATAAVAAQCNGGMTCSYVVHYYDFLPDPAPGKPKGFFVLWTCSGVPFQTTAAPVQPNGEAGYSAVAQLACGTAPTPPTWPTTPPGRPASFNLVTFSCAPPMPPCSPLALVVKSDGQMNVTVSPKP